jgi:hypothetical protein
MISADYSGEERACDNVPDVDASTTAFLLGTLWRWTFTSSGAFCIRFPSPALCAPVDETATSERPTTPTPFHDGDDDLLDAFAFLDAVSQDVAAPGQSDRGSETADDQAGLEDDETSRERREINRKACQPALERLRLHVALAKLEMHIFLPHHQHEKEDGSSTITVSPLHNEQLPAHSYAPQSRVLTDTPRPPRLLMRPSGTLRTKRNVNDEHELCAAVTLGGTAAAAAKRYRKENAASFDVAFNCSQDPASEVEN